MPADARFACKKWVEALGSLKVRGARESNLRAVNLDLPLERLVVFTGPSGSGKSSLALDTLHAEAQRRYLNAFSSRMRGLLHAARRPLFSSIEGLPPTIGLDQRPRALPRAQRVGRVAGVDEVLRLLWGRAGSLHCPQCEETIRSWTHDEIVAEILRLPPDERVTLEAPAGQASAGVLDEILRAGFSRVRVHDKVVRVDACAPEPEADLRVVIDRVRIHPDRRQRLQDAVRLALETGEGSLVVVMEGASHWFASTPRCHACKINFPVLEPSLLDVRSHAGRCEVCDGQGREEETVCVPCEGSGLGAVARAVRWSGRRFDDVWGEPLDGWGMWLSAQTPDEVSRVPYGALARRVEVLLTLGLGELSLGCRAREVSSGERQRLRLARQVSSDLSGVLYVFDEPTSGLDDTQAAGVALLLKDLVKAGNSVLVVEHHAAVIQAADHVVEFGPGAGEAGGEVLFEGEVTALERSATPSGLWLQGALPALVRRTREATGTFTWVGLEKDRWAESEVTLPLGQLVALTGANGAGKSLLLAQLGQAWGDSDDARSVVWVDGEPAQSARSNLSTYVGLWTELRTLMAATRESRVRGFKPGTFSLAKRGGRCEACGGQGTVSVDLDFLPRVSIPCEVCGGRRFQADVLQVQWRGHAPDQLLALTVEAAHNVLAGHPKLERILRALKDVGLGYVTLGQTLAALSGGEAKRLHLARELTRLRGGEGASRLYLVEHPEVGLHAKDLPRQLGVLQHLVDEGATVWFTTHRQELAEASDAVLHLDRAHGDKVVRTRWVRQGA